MKHICITVAALMSLMLLAMPSKAQSARTFVSGQGKDKGACTQAAPCRTFTQAMQQTIAGGVVIAVDSASYAPFTINKAITVEAPMGAAVNVTSGDGIEISAGTNDVVILRGLTVNNDGSSGNGIGVNSGGTVHIERCVANGFSGFGMAGISITGPGTVLVKDTIARNNYNGIGANMGTSATATVSLTLDELHLDANRIGLFVQTQAGQAVNGSIHNSSASANADVGVLINSNAGGNISLDVESCLFTNTGIGMVTESAGTGAATAYISFCSITHNTINGFSISGTGAIFSRGNNTLADNAQNIGTLTSLAGQ